jgi:lipopolysaccharide biosynthesis glycosyltransferase
MNILLSSDDNYAPLLGITIQSLLENNENEFDDINFYILDGGISENNKTKLNEITYKFNINVLVEYIPYDNIDKLLDKDVKATIALSSYARLLAPSLLDNSIDKIIYMDCDALVTGSLKEIWDTDISDYDFGAVLDLDSKHVNKFLEISSDVHYNAGFLFINLKRWRDNNLENKFLDYLIEKDGEVYHNDQGILNHVCEGNILTIPPKYNVLSCFFEVGYDNVLKWYDCDNYYPKEVMEDAIANPVFIHLTKFVNGRPWFKDAKNHPLRKLFEEYANRTPFEHDEIYIDNKESGIWKIFLLGYKYLPFSLLCYIFRIYRLF